MGVGNAEPVVFEAIQADGAMLHVPLVETPTVAISATAISHVAFDAAGERFFVKDRVATPLEYDHLLELRERDIPVPRVIALSPDGTEIATSYAGEPMSEVPVDAIEMNGVLLSAGVLLRSVHQSLQARPPGVHTQSYSPTAHIVDCFFYKWPAKSNGATVGAYAVHKMLMEDGTTTDQRTEPIGNGPVLEPFIVPPAKAPTALMGLVGVANELAEHSVALLKPHLVQYDPQNVGRPATFVAIRDAETCYGDFKPENILIAGRDGSARLSLIDPVLTRGSRYFDLAKFAARFMLDNPGCDYPRELSPFFQGYGASPQPDAVYGPLTFNDLVGMDMLNAVRMYAKRYGRGDVSYRLVRSLDDSAFCRAVRRLLSNVANQNWSDMA